jgi:hypothetical protein
VTNKNKTSGWVLAMCALAWAVPAQALQHDETRKDLRLSLSVDFMHANGATLLAGRYGGAWGLRAGAWLDPGDVHPEPHGFVGADHVWTFGKWRAGLGAIWMDEKTNINGTNWLFDVSLGYDISRRVFVEYRHHSHGSRLGIRRDVPNGGWNLLGVGIAFD